MPRIEQMKTVEGVRLGENLSLVAAVRDIFKGEYIKRSWESKSDGVNQTSRRSLETWPSSPPCSAPRV